MWFEYETRRWELRDQSLDEKWLKVTSQGTPFHKIANENVLTAAVHWITSRQASLPAFSLKSSPALLS